MGLIGMESSTDGLQCWPVDEVKGGKGKGRAMEKKRKTARRRTVHCD